jgi:isopenicillin N synthase-like dioxygenase
MTGFEQTIVPLIDLAAPEPEVARAIALACEDWGFFQIVGHGVNAAVTDAVMDQARAFFARPKTDKRALSRTARNPWGYYDRELTKNLRDKKEIFDIGPDTPVGGADDLWAARTPWPPDGEAFRNAVLAYIDACEALSKRLLGLVLLGLGVDRSGLDAAFAPASTSFLRLNHYPVSDPLEDTAEAAAAGADLGIHHHTDAGALTVLLQDDVDGLQVWRDHAWRAVAPTRGALVVNIGDMIQVWSNDLYRAPLHRVLAMDAVDRLSLPLFLNPAYEAVIAPLDRCIGEERPARYHPIRWGEFRNRRAEGDFADHGAEVQISDYARSSS